MSDQISHGTTPILIIVLLLSLCSQSISIYSNAVAQLPLLKTKSSTSRVITSSNPNSSNPNNVTMTIHTTNSIQGNNFDSIKQQEPVIRKAIISSINDALSVARGNIKSLIPVNVNARIINQLSNRVDTTQGIDMTKKLIATELTNVINGTTTNLHQPAKVVVDNQAICSGIASPTKAACSFTINIHG